MKLNNSFSIKNYYSSTNPAANHSLTYGASLSQHYLKPTEKRKAFSSNRYSNRMGYTNPNNFSTVEHNHPQRLVDNSSLQARINLAKKPSNYLDKVQHDIVNQTIQPHYQNENFQSINFMVEQEQQKKYEDFERALSYNIIKTHQTIQQVEKECEHKIIQEKKRYKEKENENRQKIKQLVNKIESEKDKRLLDLSNQTEIKKKNLELRKRVSELIYENNQLIVTNDSFKNQIEHLQKTTENQQSQLQQYQAQIIQLNQKMNKKVLKREVRIDEIQDQHNLEIRKLQKEIQSLMQQNKELEFELYTYKKQGQISQQDQTLYEDRIKQLLLDLELQSKKYIQDVNGLHDYYRQFVNQARDLEEKLKIYQHDFEQATLNERAVRVENVRLKLEYEEIVKQVKKKNYICEKCLNTTIRQRSPIKPQLLTSSQTDLIQSQQEDEESHFIQNGKKQKLQPNNNQQQDKSPEVQAKNRRHSQTQQELQVLSNLVDNIQQNSALCNGYIRKTFSLQNILFRGKELISKNQMMEELAEYDNLIRAMGALFYTSKRMGDVVPCVFQAWKDFSFEMRANKIRTLLSESKKNASPDQKKQNITYNRGQELGSQGMTINYDNNQSEDYYYEDGEEDMQANEEEEFMQVQDSNRSYSILPVNNIKSQNQRYDSQYEDGEEEDLYVEEEEDDEEEEQAKKQQEKSKKEKWDFNPDGPEVQNAKLLEKYAQMQGVNIHEMNDDLNGGQDEDDDQQMVFVDENGKELDHETLMRMMGQEGIIQGEDGEFYYQDYEDNHRNNNVDEEDYDEEEKYQEEDILTGDDYINDEEEAAAQLLKEKQKLKEKILYHQSTSNEGSGNRKSKNKKVQQLGYYEEMDEDGNLYLYEKQ